MSKYAYFDASNDGTVLQWIDTDALNYVLPDAAALYLMTDAEWDKWAGQDAAVRDNKLVKNTAPPSAAHVWKGGKWVPDAAKQAELDAHAKAASAARIDDAVATIYARFTRFESEYAEREAQARAYKAANYTGAVPVQVAAFATPAGRTAKESTDIILAQADALRSALSQLGVLRMCKYEVLGAPDDATQKAKAAEVLAAINTIGAAL